MRVDICYIVSHGFASRMLLQTDLIGRLTKEGHSVAIVSQNKDDESFRQYNENPNVHLAEWTETSSIWDDNYLYKRMYFLEEVNKNTALKEKFYNSLFYSNSKHPWKRVRPLYYYLTYKLIKLFPIIRIRFQLKEDNHLKSEQARSLLQQLNPTQVVSTYPVSIIEAKFLYEAKKRGIGTTLHLLSWDNITCKGRFPVLADSFIVWGDIMKKELIDFYKITEDRIDVCGVPHFDIHSQGNEKATDTLLSDISLNPEQPYLLFAMSSPRFAPKEIEIVEWLACKVDEGYFGSEMQLIVRPHPQNVTEFTSKKSWLDRLMSIESRKVKIDYPLLIESKIRWSMQKEDMVRLSSIISKCRICINSGSTVSIDALFHSKPVIITSFDGTRQLPYWNSARRLKDYNHLRKFIAQGGAKTAGSFEELSEWIKLFINDPSYELQQREDTLFEYCFENDGKATERVASSLHESLNQSETKIEV